jgi:hypothetical protein
MTSTLGKEPRRFAPLGEGGEKKREGFPKLKGIVFDVDGTLWLVWMLLFVLTLFLVIFV